MSSIQKLQSLFFLLITTLHIQSAPLLNVVVATIPVGPTPDGIAFTPNSLFAYVANDNNNSLPGGDSVSVINTITKQVVATIPLVQGSEPFTVTINAAGTLAYVTNSNSTTISIINTATNTVTGTINGFDGPSGMVISPNGVTAYVNNYGGPSGVGSGNGNTISIVNLNTNTITGTITINPTPPAAAPAAVAISPNGEFLYVINYVDGNPGTGTMSVINTISNTVVATITGFSGPFGIAITPNGQFAYVTNFGSNNFAPVGNTVSVVNLSTNTIVDTITVGTQPSGIAITPDGKYVYVSNYDTLYLGPNFTNLTAFQGTVQIIRTSDNTIIPPTIVVGASPSHIAITPNGLYAYVSNYTDNTVSVIQIYVERMWLQPNCCCS